MGLLSNIVCKTAGIAGMGAVVYDACKIGHEQSYRTSQMMQADSFERIHAAKRTMSYESHVVNAMQNKVADLRMDNPIIPVWGRIKGFIEGSLESLGNNFIPVACSTIAILGKGAFAKIGAWGLAGFGVYTILKEGFGIGKNTPMDKI